MCYQSDIQKSEKKILSLQVYAKGNTLSLCMRKRISATQMSKFYLMLYNNVYIYSLYIYIFIFFQSQGLYDRDETGK